VNGDDKPDLVVADSFGNELVLLLNQGNATFGVLGIQTDTNPQSKAASVFAADLDGDGKPDLVVANQHGVGTLSGDVAVLLNEGNATFAPPVIYSSVTYPWSVGAADVNGDGKPDLLVCDWGASALAVMLNQGGATFGAPVAYPVGSQPQALVAADLNGDGKLDVAVANHGSSTVSVLLNQGDGTFAPSVSYPSWTNTQSNGGPRSIAALDVDGDGKLDLVAANFYSGTLGVLINQGGGTFITHDLLVFEELTSIVAADLNGDGRPDLAVSSYVGPVTELLDVCLP
jgi:hypothetical protein